MNKASTSMARLEKRVIVFFDVRSIITPEIIPKMTIELVEITDAKETNSRLSVNSYSQTGIINKNTCVDKPEIENAEIGSKNGERINLNTETPFFKFFYLNIKNFTL